MEEDLASVVVGKLLPPSLSDAQSLCLVPQGHFLVFLDACHGSILEMILRNRHDKPTMLEQLQPRTRMKPCSVSLVIRVTQSHGECRSMAGAEAVITSATRTEEQERVATAKAPRAANETEYFLRLR